MQLDLLWQYMQVDMDAERFEQEMRNSPNRQQLIKQRNFLRDQQANMARIEDDVAGMLDRLEAVRAFLLSHPNVSLRQAAANFGFCDEFHLSKTYKQHYGVSPGNHHAP